MKPGLAAVIVTIAFGSVPPIEPPEEMRRFRDIDAAPYSGTTNVDIPFTYEAERAEATTIEVKFYDETHAGALIYARQIEPTLMFSSHVALPIYLQQASTATLRFIARNATFGIARDVPIYHTTSLHVSTFLDGEDTVVSIANFISVDAMSNLVISAEQLRFQGFLDPIVTPTYGYFAFDGFHIIAVNPGNQAINFTNLTLLIGDPNRQFPLLRRSADNAFILISLNASYNSGVYHIYLNERLYVDPITYIVSSYYIQGFVPSARFYFPKDRFRALQRCGFSIIGTVTMANTFTFQYQAEHYAEAALVGPCQSSRYCVITSDEDRDIASYDEVTFTRG